MRKYRFRAPPPKGSQSRREKAHQLSRKKDKQNSKVSTIVRGTLEMEERENLTPTCRHF